MKSLEYMLIPRYNQVIHKIVDKVREANAQAEQICQDLFSKKVVNRMGIVHCLRCLKFTSWINQYESGVHDEIIESLVQYIKQTFFTLEISLDRLKKDLENSKNLIEADLYSLKKQVLIILVKIIFG